MLPATGKKRKHCDDDDADQIGGVPGGDGRSRHHRGRKLSPFTCTGRRIMPRQSNRISPASSPAALPPSSLSQAQCHLNEAMELLDPSPDAGPLTTSSIAKAYDCLLSALATPSTDADTRPRGQIFPNQLDDTQFSTWMSVQADVYRALLLSAHLMLGMAQRESIDTRTGTDDETHDKSQEDVVLDVHDVSILKRTERRCKLLLLELSEIVQIRRKGQGTVKRSGDKHEDWHDSILTRSTFQLLRECFEFSEAADGTKERLVSLDLLNDEEIYDLSVLNANEAVDIDVNDDDIGRKTNGRAHDDSAEDIEDDIGSIGFDRQLLEKEENELIDIAMPETIVEQNGARNPNTGEKRKRNGKSQGATITKNRRSLGKTNIAKQGYLVHVNSRDNNASSSSTRCFVKLAGSELLSIQPIEGKKADAATYYISDGCRCEPRPIGDTFHFSVSCVEQIRRNTDGKLNELLFKVDEKTGGGLAEGFAWVSAISEIAEAASSIRQRQDKIRREWSEEEWKEIAQDRAKASATA